MYSKKFLWMFFAKRAATDWKSRFQMTRLVQIQNGGVLILTQLTLLRVLCLVSCVEGPCLNLYNAVRCSNINWLFCRTWRNAYFSSCTVCLTWRTNVERQHVQRWWLACEEVDKAYRALHRFHVLVCICPNSTQFSYTYWQMIGYEKLFAGFIMKFCTYLLFLRCSCTVSCAIRVSQPSSSLQEFKQFALWRFDVATGIPEFASRIWGAYCDRHVKGCTSIFVLCEQIRTHFGQHLHLVEWPSH